MLMHIVNSSVVNATLAVAMLPQVETSQGPSLVTLTYTDIYGNILDI